MQDKTGPYLILVVAIVAAVGIIVMVMDNGHKFSVSDQNTAGQAIRMAAIVPDIEYLPKCEPTENIDCFDDKQMIVNIVNEDCEQRSFKVGCTNNCTYLGTNNVKC